MRSVTQRKRKLHVESSANSESRLIAIPTLQSQQNLCSKILFREAAIYHDRESSLFTPHGEQLSPAAKKLELRLIHAFIYSLSPVQSSPKSVHVPPKSVKDIPFIANKHVYARDILLGCSALYLRAHNPNDKALVQASHEYAVRAIAECSNQLQNGVHRDNAEGLFFTSMFIAKHAFVSRMYDDLVGDKTSCEQGELPLLRWLRQFHGIKAIIDAGWAWIPNSEHVSPMLDALPPPITRVEDHERSVLSSILEGLDEGESHPETVATYRHTVAYLTSVINDPGFRGLLGFPIAVPERLIELLEKRDPRAMIIIATYLAILILVPRSDFLRAAAMREYRAIKEQLPAEWLPRMEWATNVIEPIL